MALSEQLDRSPSHLDRKVEHTVCDLVAAGVGLGDACRALNVPETAVHGRFAESIAAAVQERQSAVEQLLAQATWRLWYREALACGFNTATLARRWGLTQRGAQKRIARLRSRPPI